MRGAVARDLRKLAHTQWAMQDKEMQRVVSKKMIYKQLKKEFYDEKGR